MIMVLDFHFYTISVWASSSFKIHNKMEEVDECLMITNIDISCWKKQLKQADVNPTYTNQFSCKFDQFLLVTLVNLGSH